MHDGSVDNRVDMVIGEDWHDYPIFWKHPFRRLIFTLVVSPIIAALRGLVSILHSLISIPIPQTCQSVRREQANISQSREPSSNKTSIKRSDDRIMHGRDRDNEGTALFCNSQIVDCEEADKAIHRIAEFLYPLRST